MSELSPVRLTRQQNFEGKILSIHPLEFKEDDFEMAMTFSNMSKFYLEKHKHEYTGDLETLSLDNEDMDTSDDE